MKRRFFSIVCCVLLGLGAGVVSGLSAEKIAAAPTPEGKGGGFTEWELSTPNAFWRVEGGVLIGENNAALTGNMLWTKRSYKDFTIEFDVRWEGPIDSGVMFRTPVLQMQIGTSISLKKELTGSFYTGDAKARYPEEGKARDAERLLKPGQWNRLRLEVRGDSFNVWINGEKAGNYTNAKYSGEAPIGLQIHPKLKMKVEYRDIHLVELR
jgi:hypothetical protein